MPEATWSTLASYGTMSQALAAERKLHDAGIRSRILEDGATEQTVGLYWTASTVNGGTLLQVPPSELQEAAKVLDIPGETLVPTEEEEKEATTNAADADAARAVRAAVLGLFMCPGVAHVYAMSVAAGISPYALSDKGRRDRGRAMLISGIVIALIVVGFVTTR
jgi:hypothetical protein